MFFLIAVISNPVFIKVKQTFYLQNLKVLGLNAFVLLVLMGKSAVSLC